MTASDSGSEDTALVPDAFDDDVSAYFPNVPPPPDDPVAGTGPSLPAPAACRRIGWGALAVLAATLAAGVARAMGVGLSGGAWDVGLFVAATGSLLAAMAAFAFSFARTSPATEAREGGADAFPASWDRFLLDECAYYRALDAAERARFQDRIRQLARAVPVHHADPPPEEDEGDDGGADADAWPDAAVRDRLRVWASASALGFGFARMDWRGLGLREIILREGAVEGVDHARGSGTLVVNFDESGSLGEEGLMNGVMTLAAADVEEDWAYPEEGANVALHEFAHVADHEALARIERARPGVWARLMQWEAGRVRGGKTDLDEYALYDEREFLAVASEYFFMAPERFRRRHRPLYAALAFAWRQDPASLAARARTRGTAQPPPNNPGPDASGPLF